jgi:hypothetical protein
MRHSKIYNRYIRQAREAVKGTTGIDRIIAITEYFNEVGHPHAYNTGNKLIMDRIFYQQSDRDFAYKVMSEMAYLVATNEELVAEMEEEGVVQVTY